MDNNFNIKNFKNIKCIAEKDIKHKEIGIKHNKKFLALINY